MNKNLAVGMAIFFTMLASAAQARIIVRSVKDLETGKEFKAAQMEYHALSSANVVFAQCADTYPSIATDQDYLTQRFGEVYEAYLKAYYNNYVALVGYPPPQKLVDEYVARIRTFQQNVVNDTAKTIRDQGCGNYAIENNINYVTKSHALADAAKANQGSQP